MSDTTEAAVQKLLQQVEELEAVSREIHRVVGEEEAELAITFAELFFSKAPPGFLGSGARRSWPGWCWGPSGSSSGPARTGWMWRW
jgi:hypothetical protein